VAVAALVAPYLLPAPQPSKPPPRGVLAGGGEVKYLSQVRQIVPVALVGREAVLAELAAFCTEPDRGPYGWWQAPAWAGKSALMSWFVLHPPEGVQIVSFFITARWASQHDRVAFTDVLFGQLADLTGRGEPAGLTSATRDSHLLHWLEEAARACQRYRRRLVLAVDGLDEDRGVTTGPGAHSIAALLPAQPVAGMRVIVAGRPNPPVPPDVPNHHPLRDPGIVRALDRSRYATDAEAGLKDELDRLLHGTRIETDLLGVLTSAVGGLTVGDLAELTGAQEWQVEEQLRSVSGRTFNTRLAYWAYRGSEVVEEHTVYVLAHEDLQVMATERLGEERLAEYRDRLHDWADRYRKHGWPASTPEYLLRGYFRMLQANNDIDRIVECATDPARHERIRHASGDDATALSEVSVAEELVRGRNPLDPRAIALLSRRRDYLLRNRPLSTSSRR
jgi:hypothetical protein